MRIIKNIGLTMVCPQHLIAVLLCVVLMAPAARTAEKPLLMPSAKDKCPVCGMYVMKYPDWITVISFKNGSYAYFDGAKDMFKFLQTPSKYKQVRTGGIRAIFIRDYYSLEWFDARRASFVIGSDIYGPMGRELIPLKSEADAREFANDHRGKKILNFSEITPEIIKTLD
ncbi:MAG: nitrous oxide reductase accessory protein NosL [Smithella sp.]